MAVYAGILQMLKKTYPEGNFGIIYDNEFFSKEYCGILCPNLIRFRILFSSRICLWGNFFVYLYIEIYIGLYIILGERQIVNPFLTIYTPTYNRAYILSALWDSLCRQTKKNFVWLIVDDGSGDDTASLVRSWEKISPFKIQYVFQKNSGKHVATNKAIELCNTPLFMVVDSDDKLTEHAVEIIYRYYKDDQKDVKKSDGEIIGWLMRRGNMQGQVSGKSIWLPNEPTITILDLHEKYGYCEESTIVWKTAVIKPYRYPVIESEKFVTELVMQYQISFVGPVQLKNDILVLSEYRDDGYTNQGIKLQVNNPRGEAVMLKTRAVVRSGWRRRLSALIKYYAWLRVFKISEQIARKDYRNLQFGDLPIEEGYIKRSLAKCLAYIWEPLIKKRINRRLERLHKK